MCFKNEMTTIFDDVTRTVGYVCFEMIDTLEKANLKEDGQILLRSWCIDCNCNFIPICTSSHAIDRYSLLLKNMSMVVV